MGDSKRRTAGPLCAALALLGASGAPHAQQLGAPDPVTRVVCDGLACGGSGGGSASQFLYRVQPRGEKLGFFEVGVEDGDLARYGAFVMPPGWEVELVALARAHDEHPSAHGELTGQAGACPFVLRFQHGTLGAAQDSTFEVGFDSTHGMPGFHDVDWRTNGEHAEWSFPVGTGHGPVHSPFRMNVLVVVLDDVGTDKIGLYDELYEHLDEIPGSPAAGTRTPRLDRLAGEGIVFTNYYTNPLCSASRASLLTGRRAFRTGLGSIMRAPNFDCPDPTPKPGESCFTLLDEELFLPELLRDGFAPAEAYTSGAFGKWHLSYWTPDEDLPPVAGLESHPVDNGFARFEGTLENVGYLQVFDHFVWRKAEHDAGGVPEVLVVADLWDASAARMDALEWINARTQPFFAWVAFNPPHVPAVLPPPELLSPETRAELAACPAPCRDPLLLFRAQLEAVDTELGNLLDGIDPAKLANTMVFVISDNGTAPTFIAPPHDRTHGKSSVYQIGVRAPMIVSGPLIRAAPPGGWRCSQLVEAVDLWRTVADITGASETRALESAGLFPCAEPWIDSISFAPLLRAPDGPGARVHAFAQQFVPNLEVADACTTIDELDGYDCLYSDRRALTDGEFKLIRQRSSGACDVPLSDDEELYWIGPVERAGSDVGEVLDLLDESDVLISEAPPHAAPALEALRLELDSLGRPPLDLPAAIRPPR